MKLVNLITTTFSPPCCFPAACKPQFEAKRYHDRLKLGSVFYRHPFAKATAREVIRAYNVWDIEAILAYRTPDCKHQVLPLSMNRTGKSNDEYRAYFESIRPNYVNFTATVIEELHDAKTHKCIIHARSKAQTAIGLYANEYALILSFTEDGKKVSHFDEFVDSAYSVKFQADLAKALAGNSTHRCQ
ncbi:hypothetical protein A1F94_009111 [Pyrenophora tritici-repentis]|nr:hypothetical protein A1F94_009111 [Pyrenophora tritici-repentis]